MYEFLEKVFGKNEDGTDKALTFKELQAALTAAKDISVVNLKDGGYVSKDKFDAKETELTGVKAQLADANKTIQSYKDMDIEGVKKAASDWETKYNADTKALNDKLSAQAREFAETLLMSGYRFTSKAAKNGIIAELREKKFELKDGSLVGAKEYMDGLMKNEEYAGAFVSDEDKPEAEKKPRFAASSDKTETSGGEKYVPPLVF